MTAPSALDLSERFFNEVALPSLKERFPEDWNRIGAGLVGNGSECMGFDDELSQDHDWGVEFFVWLSPDDYGRIGDAVREWKADLFASHPEVAFRNISDYGVRQTVLTPGMFYKSLIGFEEGPRTVLEWRRVPETNLVLATNGCVFVDPLGEFTRVREHLMGYYPEELRKKKIAARCLAMAQTGQYNFLRIAQRGDVVGKEIALSKFVQDAVSMVFMLNRRFMPYYKWAFHAMRGLDVLAPEVAPLIEALYTGGKVEGELDPGNVLLRPVSERDRNRAVIVEKICALVADELRAQGLSDAQSTFLVQHGESVQAKVEDPDLRRLPTQYE